MSENRKYYPNGTVFLCTGRTEEGLPFVPNVIMNFILWGNIASAKAKFNVSVCHFLWMGNHFHLIVVAKDSEHVSAFLGYIKSESAHAVNRLLGRKRRTVWQAGNDTPALLSAETVMYYIMYIYCNPARAGLVETIGDYPGVSSWEMFTKGENKKVYKRIRRSSLKKLWNPELSINEQKRLIKKYEEAVEKEPEHTFTLEPNDWVRCFPESRSKDIEEINAEIRANIEKQEKEYAEQRKKEKKRVLGATALKRQSIARAHVPEKRTPRMICICWDKELRRAYIEHFRELCREAARVYQLWKQGDLSARIPPGMFAPRVPWLACALSPLN